MKKSVTILYLIIASAVSIAVVGSVFFLVFSAKLDEYSRLSIHTNAQTVRFLEEDSGLPALKGLSHKEAAPKYKARLLRRVGLWRII